MNFVWAHVLNTCDMIFYGVFYNSLFLYSAIDMNSFLN